ncbi:MAG: hypothetical protein C5B50_21785 [Verrucomicrobia bacterium]|nr:MAG: hypothetical protein C5B50_21785 [Verrucomicrobiota bacterium]
MTIYADTSFLISFLYPGDRHHGAIRHYCEHQAPPADWLISVWSQFEAINSLRQLCLSRPGPSRQMIEGIRLLFKQWLRKGPFELVRVNLDDALIDCAKISAGFGATMRARSADTLHVAILEQLNPDLFVTRDRNQFDLAVARGFRGRHFP